MANNKIPQQCVLCGEKVVGWGYCEKHYRRWRRHGDPTYAKFLYFQSIEDEGFADYFWSKALLTANEDKCWEWHGRLEEQGYGVIQVNNRVYKAHRVAWMLANQRQSDCFILHSCDNRRCVNPSHLREGTNQDNMTDMVIRGRSKALRADTQKPGKGKVTIDEVRTIKQLLTQQVPINTIANIYGVSRSLIGNINTGKTWQHVVL